MFHYIIVIMLSETECYKESDSYNVCPRLVLLKVGAVHLIDWLIDFIFWYKKKKNVIRMII